MNQDCYNSKLSGFDQYQPPQFLNNHQFPQETSKEILQARDDLMEAIQAFLKEYDHIPPNEKCMALLLAEERFLKIKQAMEEEQNQPEVMQELLLKLKNYLDNFIKDVCTFLRKFSRIPFGVTPKVIVIAWESFGKVKDALTDKQYQQEDIQELISELLEDVRNIEEELPEYINSITPVLPIEEPNNSLRMGDEHLDTISSVENLVPILSELEGISKHTCDMHVCDFSPPLNALKGHVEIFSDSNDDSNNDDSFENIDYVKASPPDDSLIMGNEELSTMPKKESDELINSSVKDLVPIPSESEDILESDSDCDLPLCDDFSSIDIPRDDSMTFSNPLFDSNDDFTSSDDESLSDEDDIGCKDSYDSNLDELTFLVTPLSDFNKDEFFTPNDDVEFLLHHDPFISVVSILEGFIDEPPLEEDDDLFDLESKTNNWKKILYDAPIIDLITEDKVFDPRIYEKKFSLTFVKLTFKDRHYLPITFVI
ncbi:hypothetical protein Tco_0104867 [Tanacetum coccineum]